VGEQVRRGKPRRVDYLLRLTDGFEIAVIEAEPENSPAEDGLEQAKAYAKDLGLAFAYATNGHRILEYAFFTHTTRELGNFPRPEELWYRWKINTGTSSQDMVKEERAAYIFKLGAERQQNPLLYGYCPESLCGKKPFYFQEVAIREIIKRIMRGQRRILLTMATGTGKNICSVSSRVETDQIRMASKETPRKACTRVISR